MADSTRHLRRSLRHVALIAATMSSAGCLEHRDLPEHYASPCSGCHGDPARFSATAAQADAGEVLLSAAPPFDVQGHTSSSQRGVGAHLAHITETATHLAIDCVACHPGVVPSIAQDNVTIYHFTQKHIDGTTVLAFSGMATAKGYIPSFDTTTLTCSGSWCHGPFAPANSASPAWNNPSASLGCTGCHGAPPPSPHPSVTGGCSCHTNVTASFGFVDKAKHINGAVDF